MQIKVNLTPYQKGGHTKWTIDVVDNGNGKPGGKGQFGGYPTIYVRNQNQPIFFTITDNSWGFAADALWVSTGKQDPTKKSQMPGLINITYQDATHLHVTDANGPTNAGDLHYTLNFAKPTGVSSTLDPIFNNGGNNKGAFGFSTTQSVITALVLVAIVVALIAWRKLKGPEEPSQAR